MKTFNLTRFERILSICCICNIIYVCPFGLPSGRRSIILTPSSHRIAVVTKNIAFQSRSKRRHRYGGSELQTSIESSIHNEDVEEKNLSQCIVNIKNITDDNTASENTKDNYDDTALNASLSTSNQEEVVKSVLSELKNIPTAPTMNDIIKFAIPATGIWLCSPLLSLIDTSIVGYFAGTVQQAALNPAVALTDFGELLVAFMYTATTNLIATAKGKDDNNGDDNETKKTLVAALRLAVVVGLVFGSALATFAPILVKILLGGKVVDPVVLTSAIKYVQIRAVGMPAAVVIGTAQSACLGMKDVKGPLMVITLSGIVNFFGDILFVPLKNSVIGGSVGAACATSLSQYAALFMFVRWLRNIPKDNAKKSIRSPSRGLLGKEFNVKKLLSIPSLTDIKDFFPFMLPVTTTAVGRVSGYVAMSHVVSSTLGTVEMAAQQIILALFMCFIPVCESINLTAQSFMPGIFDRKDSEMYNRVETMKKTVWNFTKTGALYGAFLFCSVLVSPFFSPLFTQDVLVQQSMKTVIPYVAGFFAASGLVTSGEGLLLGQKDLKFLGRAFSAYCIAMPYFLLRLKSRPPNGLIPMWRIFLIYNSVRMVIWSSRLLFLLRKETFLSNSTNERSEKTMIT